MKQFLARRIFLVIAFLFVCTIFANIDSFAQENAVTSNSVAFEDTTIIEFENNDSVELETVRMWLGSDFTFKSFKTEKNWTGQKTPQGVIIFTTNEPIQPGESVKFGIKTDKVEPKINWRVFDKNENEVGTGVTLVTTTINENTQQIETTESSQNDVFVEAIFKIIPEKPKVGNSIRVAGEKFGANQKLDLYIGGERIESVQTDKAGNFMITTKVPETITAERTDFIVRDFAGNEKIVSLRLGESDSRLGSSEVRLTVSGLPDTVFRGDKVMVTGTAKPDSTVTATFKDKNGNTMTTLTASSDFQGNWLYEQTVPLNSELGERAIVITDGTDIIERKFNVAASEKILITPLRLKFEPGELIVFNGTAIPDQELEAVLEDPSGVEFASQIIDVDSSGNVSFEFPTLESSLKGTYVLVVSQGVEREIFTVGLGIFPQEPVIMKLDKLNYKAGDIAIIDLKGPSSATLSLLVLDPSDKEKYDDFIVLGPDGSASYNLPLNGYASGVYSIVVKRATDQYEAVFTVGLQTGSGPIQVRTTKDTYTPGEDVLILGSSAKNILLTITLTDPDGNIVKRKESFTDKNGIFTEGSFRIPLSAKEGIWIITTTSGTNSAKVDLKILKQLVEGLVVELDKESYRGGDILTVNGFGAKGGKVFFDILDFTNSTFTEFQSPITDNGNFQGLWKIPAEIEPGTYILKAKDSFKTIEITINIVK
ncbi:MAG: biofilm-associated protein [Nitrosopumilales archaeon]|nr:biofilm-associated protein [Nitrosopumilales archaeon]